MKIVLERLGEVILLLYAFWLLFVMCMGFYAAWQKMPLVTKLLAVPAVVLAFIFDVAWNWTLGSLGFLELPPKGTYTFTQRLSIYKQVERGWRGTLAYFICDHFLDVFQSGGHCR